VSCLLYLTYEHCLGETSITWFTVYRDHVDILWDFILYKIENRINNNDNFCRILLTLKVLSLNKLIKGTSNNPQNSSLRVLQVLYIDFRPVRSV
jgi:hypothetical protein